MTRERPEEDKAASIVGAATSRRTDRRDRPGAESGTYDFAILEGPREVGALEVTSLAVEGALGLEAAIGRHGQGIETEDLARRWVISLGEAAEERGASYREIKRRLIPFLVAIEAEGRQSFHTQDGWRSSAVRRLIEALPVETGFSYERTKQPRVLVLPPGRAAMVGGEVAHRAIEEAAAGDRFAGERRKLKASNLAERHLFVWVHTSLWEVWAAVRDESPPERAPVFPEEITSLWLAAMGAPDYAAVWRADRGGPWALLVPGDLGDG